MKAATGSGSASCSILPRRENQVLSAASHGSLGLLRGEAGHARLTGGGIHLAELHGTRPYSFSHGRAADEQLEGQSPGVSAAAHRVRLSAGVPNRAPTLENVNAVWDARSAD